MSDTTTSSESAQVKNALLARFANLPKRAFQLALVVDGVLLALYVIGLTIGNHVYSLFFLLDLNAEGNPPSWWFGTQQFLVALTFLLLASWLFANDTRVQPVRKLFFAAGLGFLFISADEIGELHEYGSRILEQSRTVREFEGRIMHLLHITHTLRGGGLWIAIYVVIGVGLVIWAIPYVKKAYVLWRKQLLTAVLGFSIFAFSAAVLQVVGYFFHTGSTAHNIYVFIEQALKMFGISIVLYGAMQVLAECAGRLTRTVAGDKDVQQIG
jgi:hypothetical protein